MVPGATALRLTPGVLDDCRKIPISNNVGTVKHSMSTQARALVEERHFALVDGLRLPTGARF